MVETLFVMVGVCGCFVFAPRIGADKAGPRGRFPWVPVGLRVSDLSLAGTAFVMVPLTYFALHTPLWPLGWLTGGFSAWVMWAWAVLAWRR